MGAIIGSGYDVVMVGWGVAFIVGAVAFVFGMNSVFQAEERRLEAELGERDTSNPMDHHPLRPAA